MESTCLKLGFLGGALDSAVGTTHVLASQLDRRWKLVAACFSPNESLNLETGQKWGIQEVRQYNRWQDMLNAEVGKLDAIGILTPTPLHAEMAVAALRLGYPVICEKALCTSHDEAKQIQEEVNRHNGFLAVIYNYTGYPMLREMRSRVSAGQVGKVIQVHVEMPQEGFLKLDKENRVLTPQNWRLVDGAIPTLHLDLGVHVENIIYFLTGHRAREVLAVNNTYGHFSNIIDNTLCIARYPENIDCNIWFGKSALGHSNGLRVRIYGTLGSMEWHQMSPDVFRIHDNHGSVTEVEPRYGDLKVAGEARYNRFKPGHPAGFIEAFANYYYDLATAVSEFKESGKFQNPWVFDVNDAASGMAMLNAMQVSAEKGTWCAT